jgi:hypothetical protein
VSGREKSRRVGGGGHATGGEGLPRPGLELGHGRGRAGGAGARLRCWSRSLLSLSSFILIFLPEMAERGASSSDEESPEESYAPLRNLEYWIAPLPSLSLSLSPFLSFFCRGACCVGATAVCSAGARRAGCSGCGAEPSSCPFSSCPSCPCASSAGPARSRQAPRARSKAAPCGLHVRITAGWAS